MGCPSEVICGGRKEERCAMEGRGKGKERVGWQPGHAGGGEGGQGGEQGGGAGSGATLPQ
jgi:hypothetical protein